MPGRSSATRLLIGKTLYSRAILVDTGALIALANPTDTYHEQAINCLEHIASYRLPVFVSIPTIYESYRRTLFDLNQEAARLFVERIYDGSVNIVRTIDEDEQEAMQLIERYAALKLTLTDAANMAVMVRLQIAASFSFDRHYLQAGFIRIPPFHL
jgi:predicted nucleic acid-binding protein